MENTANTTKKSRRPVLLLVLIFIAVLAAGGALYGYFLYTQPKTAVKDFLKNVQTLNFDGIASHVSNGDLTPLDNADVTNPAFEEFFRKANSLMTYDIEKASFHGKTANVTAKIKYADGTEIYKNTVSDFMKQVAASAFSGTSLTPEELRTEFSKYLNQHSQSLGEAYAETTISFYMVKENNNWYVDALDDAMVQMMSANFQAVENDLKNSLSALGSGETSDVPPANVTADSTINLSTEKFTITYTSHVLSKDYEGKPCVLVYYDYTNNNETGSSAMIDVNLKAYQNGQVCPVTVTADEDPAVAAYMNEVEAGATVNVCQVFSVSDNSDVTLTASEAYSFSDNTSAQILKLQ